MTNHKDKPSYMGWMPAEVRYDKDLIPNAKMLYTEITALANKEGFCWATNKYFAELYEVSDRSIRNWLKALADKHYIYVELVYKDGTKEVEQRKIFVNKGMMRSTEVSSDFHTPMEKNFHTPMEKNFHYNNTSINNTSINKKKYIKKMTPPSIEEVQAYIDEKGYKSVDAKMFYEYYASADWHDAKGKPVKNWKQRLVTWNNNRKEHNGQVRTGSSRQKGTYDESYILDENADECAW